MKKFSLLIAITLLASSIVFSPTTANAQDEKQAQMQRDTYAVCWGDKKDESKCLQLCSDLIKEYPTDTYAKNCKTKIENAKIAALQQKFQTSLTTYYNGPDASKLEQLFSASEEFLKAQPGHQYVIGQMALAGANGAMGQTYKNFDKVKGYAERALKAFESTTPPEGWTPAEWNPLRDIVLAQMNQYLGWRYIYQYPEPSQMTKDDQEQALSYLTKATQVKGKEGAGWKDPNNYWLRSTIYSVQYSETRKPYDAMTDEEKVSDAGKEELKKVFEHLDTKLIPEYARVVATATNPNAKPIYDAAKYQFDQFWDYRTGTADKAADYIKSYTADPTIASVPVPAKAEDAGSLDAPAAPAAGTANVKLTTGAPGANGKATTNGNGGKSTPTKGTKKATKPRGKKRGG